MKIKFYVAIISILFTQSLFALTVYRYYPSTPSVTITAGDSITFSIGADDPNGLRHARWYLNSSFQVQHSLSGYYDEDTYPKTFSTSGNYTVKVYVYNINNQSSSLTWQVTVNPRPIGTVQISSPNGGETFYSGTNNNISWTKSGNIASIDLQYTTNNGSSWTYIASPSPTSSPYSWTVPSNINSTQCKVKILGYYEGQTVSDLSNNVFTIRPNIGTVQVTTPNGGEVLYSGTNNNIYWSRSGNISSIDLQYTTNNGNTWTYIASPSPTSSPYSWAIPSTINSTQCKIKILGYYLSATASDESNNLFTIRPNIGTVQILSPNGGENFYAGTNNNISWNKSGNITSIDLQYSTDNGNNWTYIDSPSPTSSPYSWSVPSNINSTQCKVKILGYYLSASVLDESNNVFSIIPDAIGTVSIISPNGDETFYAGTNNNITWSKSGNITSIDLQYTSNNGSNWTYIASPDPSSSSYSWSVPININSTQCKVKILGYYNSQTVSDLSNNNFSILTPPINGDFFDDFNYSARTEMTNNGWNIRTYPGGPGFQNGQWRAENVNYVNDDSDPGDKLLRLISETSGTDASTYQSEISTPDLFREGTYGVRIKFNDAPNQGSDGDAVVQTFFTLSNINNTPFAEVDFEYVPNSWNGNSNPQFDFNTWKIYGAPIPENRQADSSPLSYNGWNILMLQILNNSVKFYVNSNTPLFTHDGTFYPAADMGLFFQNWFSPNGLVNGTSYRKYELDVDWIFHKKGVAMSYKDMLNAVNTFRANNLYFYTSSPLPVELSVFIALINNNNAILNWTTETEVNNYGFQIEKMASNNSKWQNIGFINGHGNSNSPKHYQFIDKNVNCGDTIYYRLKQIDNDGSFKYSQVVKVFSDKPVEYFLSQNYPNPFNPITNIAFSIPRASKVTLKIYNPLGADVATLINDTKKAGYYNIAFDASNFPSGIYFYTLRGDNFSITKKMILLK